MVERQQQREKFSSGLAVFFATLGSAVGLGNIWKFPYLTGEYGGGAFLLVYLISVLFVGIPIMLSEFFIGRRTRKNVMGAFDVLKANKGWKIIGILGIASAYLISFFYSCVAGWVYSYVFKAIRGDFNRLPSDETTAGQIVSKEFETALVGPVAPVIWQIVVVAIVSVILISGVKKGIEKVTKTLMPVLFILILICDLRSIFLPGAWEGVKFLFQVDFAKLTPIAVLTALGLAFFKLSLGMGTMVTYGSYFTDDNNMINTSFKVVLSDTLVSILAGIAIFPAVFSYGMEPKAGPGLLFMTMPMVFSKLPFGNILLIAFFILASIAATTALISMVEVPVAYFKEELGIPRYKSVIINAIIIITLGVLATLSADQTSILGNVTIFGRHFFDLFDYLSSNILLPLGGLIIAIFIGYFIKKELLVSELTNNGVLSNNKSINIYYFILKFITPALLIIVFLNSIGII